MGKLEPIWVLSKIRTSDYTSSQRVSTSHQSQKQKQSSNGAVEGVTNRGKQSGNNGFSDCVM